MHDRHHAGHHQHGGRQGAPWEASQIVGTDVSAQDKATVTVSIPKLRSTSMSSRRRSTRAANYTTLIKRSKTDPGQTATGRCAGR